MNSELEIKDKIESRNGIKIAPFRKGSRKTNPHKHKNYFEIVYLSEGSGQHVIDTREYEIKPPIAFAIRREQVHFWNIESEPSGFVIIVKKTFIEHLRDKEIRHLLAQISSMSCMYPKDAPTVLALFQLLSNEFNDHVSDNVSVIEGLLKALLVKLGQAGKANNQPTSNEGSLYEKYLDILGRGKEHLTNKVSYYADLLHTTPQNLSAACSREVNQSASMVLSEFIISEAKRLLLYTDLSITEISEALSFKDNSHFTKYFKRHVGSTPSRFKDD